MAIPIEIQGSSKGNGVSKAEIYNPSHDKRTGAAGVTVYTEDRLLKSFQPIPLSSAGFGISLAQDGSFGGTPDKIHDGTDIILWTGSNVTGNKVIFDSTDRAFEGTKSVRIDNPSNGDIWQFSKGSDLTLNNYKALTLKINIDKDWGDGDSISLYGYDTGTNTQVGNKVFIEDYIGIVDFDVWQSAVIPLTELGLTTGTINAFRMEQELKAGKAPKWYLDNFQVEETGDTIAFRYQPIGSEILHVTRISSFTVRDATTASEIQAYDKYFGEPALLNGTSVNIQSRGKSVVSGTQQTIENFLTLPQSDPIVGGDGVNSWMKINNDIVFDLDGSQQDFVEWRVQDDLTGLSVYNVWVFGWIEDAR